MQHSFDADYQEELVFSTGNNNNVIQQNFYSGLDDKPILGFGNQSQSSFGSDYQEDLTTGAQHFDFVHPQPFNTFQPAFQAEVQPPFLLLYGFCQNFFYQYLCLYFTYFMY